MPSLDAPPRHRRSSLFFTSFGCWLGASLRAGVCVLFGSSTSARLGVCLGVQCAHPPHTALCVRPSAFVALRRASGRARRPSVSLSAFVAVGVSAPPLRLCRHCAGGRASASAFPRAPHPIQWYSALSRVCRSACSIRRAPFGATWRARGLACPLSLLSPFVSAPSLRSDADTKRLLRSASNGRALSLPSSKTGVSRESKTPVTN